MDTLTDEQLLADYLAGDADAFAELVRRYNRELYQFLARFTGNAATAEDIVQETFLQVHLAARNFDTSRRFKPWLFTIAANKARDHLRSRSRRPEAPLDAAVDPSADGGRRFLDFLAHEADTPDVELADRERRDLVQRVVQEMPDHLREVLVLGYFHRLAYRDIAEILDIPLGTVKSRLHAAVEYFGRAYRAAIRNRN